MYEFWSSFTGWKLKKDWKSNYNWCRIKMRQDMVIWRIAPNGFSDAPWRSKLRHFGANAPNLASLSLRREETEPSGLSLWSASFSLFLSNFSLLMLMLKRKRCETAREGRKAFSGNLGTRKRPCHLRLSERLTEKRNRKRTLHNFRSDARQGCTYVNV